MYFLPDRPIKDLKVSCLNASSACPRSIFSNSFFLFHVTGAVYTSLRPRPQYYMGLRIASDNLVRWCFDNVKTNSLNLSLSGILKLNFVTNFLLRKKFETVPSLPKTTEKLNIA